MPVVKCRDFIEVYRQKALSGGIDNLSGRTARPDLTRFISEEILRAIEPRPTDVLVDVGCGDGSLLTLASEHLSSAIGILPTEEEVERVRGHLGDAFPAVRVQQGLAQRTNLDSGIADAVVCNGVFPLLPEAEIDAALRELARLGKPGAPVFVGEVPFLDEFAGRDYGDSVTGWLWWTLKRQGVSAFLLRTRQVLAALRSRDPFVIAPKRHFNESEARFAARAARLGLTLQWSHRHRERTAEGATADSPSRIDYLFRVG
jgi:SAM-dependent methyltransferase